MSDFQTPANFDNTVESRDFRFRFRKDKLGNQRAAVELKLNVPSVEGIIAILNNGGKEMELLQEVIADTIRSAAANIVGDTENISQDNFPHEKITWKAIANQPRAERRSIPAEMWTAFTEDYIAVMPGITGKTVQAVTNAAEVYVKKFAPAKTNKPVLELLKAQIALYAEHSPRAEEFVEILDLLITKADTLLNADSAQLLVDNL